MAVILFIVLCVYVCEHYLKSYYLHKDNTEITSADSFFFRAFGQKHTSRKRPFYSHKRPSKGSPKQSAAVVFEMICFISN